MKRVEAETRVDAEIVARLKRDLGAMIAGAPGDRAQYQQHVAAMVAKAKGDELLSSLIAPRLRVALAMHN